MTAKGVKLGRRRSVQESSRLDTLGARHVQCAHRKHAVHGFNAGGVRIQRLVERRRVLPSQKGDTRLNIHTEAQL